MNISGLFTVGAVDISGFCSEAAEILEFVGWVLFIFKIAIPLLIIAFGIFDFGKAVTAGKDDEIKKSVKTLMYRAIAGIVIFFVPTIVLWLFGAVSKYRNLMAEEDIGYSVCEDCILRPWKCQTND